MKKWVTKAIVQKTISFLPYSHSINEQFQKWVTRGIYLTDDYFADRLEHARDHLEFYRRLKGDTLIQSSLEIGTGWYPVIPISMYLSGATNICSVDISSHTNVERVLLTMEKFLEYQSKGILINYLRAAPNRLERLRELIAKRNKISFDELSRQLQIQFLIADATELSSVNDQEIDLITSNNTFEHIYPEVLAGILREFKRIAKNGGVMSHFIDMSDHFAHFDKSISIYNFLKFNDRQWKMIDNSIQPQNRLRLADYRKLYADLKIPISLEINRDGDINALRSLKINERFTRMSEKDLAVSHCYLVSLMTNNS